jgi:amino acid permease
MDKRTSRPAITRDQILDDTLRMGKTTRRAGLLLMAIENQTAYYKRASQRAAAGISGGAFPTFKTARHEVFLESLAQGRGVGEQVTIHDIERYTSAWGRLIPQEDYAMQASVAHLLGEKYPLIYQEIPQIRSALGLDKDGVKAAYRQHFQVDLASIYYTEPVPTVDRVRWGWVRVASWLENLPPFWAAFAMSLTETVGATILALPIALAGVGPLPGLALLVILGVVNILTIIGIVESIVRHGEIRYGDTYLGGLVGDYLGRLGTVVLTSALLPFVILVLIAYYVGVSSTLKHATGVSDLIWSAGLFVVVVYFLKRESLGATIASALLIGAINIGIILLLLLLTLPHIQVEYLKYVNVPFVDGKPFESSLLGLIFGTILSAYFGHTSAANVAKTVLQRDPTGRGLLWGNITAVTVAMILYGLWVLVINSAISVDTLRATNGTVLIPLADVTGSLVLVLGSIFATLGMGLSSVHISLAFYNQMREWISTVGKQLPSYSHFWLAILPIFGIFLLIEYLQATDQESFTGILGVMGVIVVPIMAGILPMLMLWASRRKGEYVPEPVFKFMGKLPVVLMVYGIFWVAIFLHGAVIWENWLERIIAIGVSLFILVITVTVIKQGAFASRTVIEVFVDRAHTDKAIFQVMSVGKPLTTDLTLIYPDRREQVGAASGSLADFGKLQRVRFSMQPAAEQLKVWVHELDLGTFSRGVPAQVRISYGDRLETLELSVHQAHVIVSVSPGLSAIELQFEPSADSS